MRPSTLKCFTVSMPPTFCSVSLSSGATCVIWRTPRRCSSCGRWLELAGLAMVSLACMCCFAVLPPCPAWLAIGSQCTPYGPDSAAWTTQRFNEQTNYITSHTYTHIIQYNTIEYLRPNDKMSRSSMISISLLLACALFFTLASAQSFPSTPLMDQLQATHDQIFKLYSAKRFADASALWTPDGIVLHAERPPAVGRQNITAQLTYAYSIGVAAITHTVFACDFIVTNGSAW